MKELIEAHKRATLGMLLRRELRGDEPMSYNAAVAAGGKPYVVFQAVALAKLSTEEYITDGHGGAPCALTDKGRTWARQLEKELHVLCKEKGVECPCLQCTSIIKDGEGENND